MLLVDVLMPIYSRASTEFRDIGRVRVDEFTARIGISSEECSRIRVDECAETGIIALPKLYYRGIDIDSDVRLCWALVSEYRATP
jgi:hypothetical protein